ncbi:hypothetical protein MPTK1_6g13150 [Marchantia polymorpha subsp. ruderalis]|uniref:Uncharacterized protein n=2 Tax=Marchantia polymorpha TaxID=3197 RepID=A0AAF6BRK3_MARPO|nr:hypothetical protein MARPO_0059s0035 [Marchantia polymorpha]BBN14637.1 hypothetical protein Mp_6g13150 [Marchantia polymorpha subsp. ruderalis]|eukprot:PTQ37086.1 hypothetical protein MARPO_0059s0035 [Marchantia polymorpha]
MASAARQGVQRSLASCSRAAVRFCNKSGPQNSSSGSSFASRLQTCSESNVGTRTGSFTAPRSPTASSSSPFTASRSSPSSPIGGRSFASQIVRLPGEIGVLQSMMPLYSATANSRLVSRIGTNGDSPILQDDEDGT